MGSQSQVGVCSGHTGLEREDKPAWAEMAIGLG
jgi:hypothetical protein